MEPLTLLEAVAPRERILHVSAAVAAPTPFFAQIFEEVVSVVDGASGEHWTVVRGANLPEPAAHDAGEQVVLLAIAFGD